MFDIHTATYVGTYTLALYSPSPGPGPVQALPECAIMIFFGEIQLILEGLLISGRSTDYLFWRGGGDLSFGFQNWDGSLA